MDSADAVNEIDIINIDRSTSITDNMLNNLLGAILNNIIPNDNQVLFTHLLTVLKYYPFRAQYFGNVMRSI